MTRLPLAVAIALAGSVVTAQATTRPEPALSRSEQWAIRSIFVVAEKHALRFASHRALFAGGLEEYRELFAPRLRVERGHATLTVGCDASSETVSLPEKPRESLAMLQRLSPLLHACRDEKLMGERTYPQGLAVSILKSLDRRSDLLIIDRDAKDPTPGNHLPTAEVNGPMGYLSIPDFRKGSGKTTAEALRRFHAEGLRGVVVDLRGTMGGDMQEMARIAGHFTARGTPLGSILGRQHWASHGFVARGEDLVPGMRVAVLVDRRTTTGGEIFARLLRSLRGATIVGETTAGNNAIHSLFTLRTGWIAAVTTAVWIPADASGAPKSGLSPDVAVDPATGSPSNTGSDAVLARALQVLSEAP